MAKMAAAKRVEMMRKERWKSKSTELTINDLIGLGVLHNRELAGWRLAGSDSYPNPQPGEIVVFEDFFKRVLGFLSIRSSKGSAYFTRLGFSIYIPTRSSLCQSLYICARHMWESNPISTSFVTCFA
jgi:hypothetical protein